MQLRGRADAYDYFFIAMSRHHLGDRQAATKSLEHGLRLVDDQLSRLPTTAYTHFGQYQVSLVAAEAQALILGIPGSTEARTES